MIAPTIIQFDGTLLCGASAPMTLRTFTPWTLWHRIMPRLAQIRNRTSPDLISLRNFNGIPVFGPQANPNFTYWGGAEVLEANKGFEHLEIPAGTYAVFHYKGLSSDSTIWRCIYSQWLPNSEWELDDRPHFERLGAQYKNEDPNSVEYVYIPIKIS
jgi:AraC family transcriptional regulator